MLALHLFEPITAKCGMFQVDALHSVDLVPRPSVPPPSSLPPPDGLWLRVFQEVYDKEFKDKYKAAGITCEGVGGDTRYACYQPPVILMSTIVLCT